MDTSKFFKVFVSIVFCLGLVLSSVGAVFADDVSGDPEASSAGTVTLDSINSLDQDVIELDNTIREVSSLLAANSEYTANDIYTLLQSVISSGKVNVKDDNAYTKLQQIYAAMFSNSLGTGTTVGVNVQNIVDTLNDMFDASSATSLFNIINNIYSEITGEESGYTAFELWQLIATKLVNIDSATSSTGILGSVDSRLATVNTNLGSILSTNTANNLQLVNIKSVLDNIHTVNIGISDTVTHIDNDIHDVKQWLDDTFYYSNTVSNFEYYIDYDNKDNPYTLHLYPARYQLGNLTGSNDSINSSESIFPVFTKEFILDHNYIVDVYFNFAPYTVSSSFNYSVALFKPLINNSLSSQGSIPVSFYYEGSILHYTLDFTSKSQFIDKYDIFSVSFPVSVSNRISLTGADGVISISPYYGNTEIINKSYFEDYKETLDKFKEIYASDDLIAAKEAQQNYEDNALENFTGSGSASASVSDLGDAASISSSLSSGLSSGGSINNALGVFDSSSNFWGWFSQDNYNLINTLSGSGSTKLLKAVPGEPEVLDFYSDNWEQLQNSLGGK